jgi:hypothetical protein
MDSFHRGCDQPRAPWEYADMSKSRWGVLFCVGAGLAGGCAGPPARPIGVCDVQLAPQVCSPVLCGNDERDLCGPTPPTFGCSDPTIFEPCDRLDLGGLTCASVGFGSGALACLSDCHGFDTSRCTSCVPGGSVEGCGQVVPSTTNVPFAADIAATDADVAMAWIEEANGQVTLRFARLDSNLDVVLEESLAEPALGASVYGQRGLAPVAIATLPSGWAIAGWTEVGLYLHGLDTAGHEIARNTVAAPVFEAGDVSNTFVRLASRPSGGPLWVWQTDALAQAAVVSDDGTSISAVVDIPQVNSNYALADAVFADGMFYVLFESRAGEGPLLARLSDTGELLAVHGLLDGVGATGISLVAGADEPQLVYWAGEPNRDVNTDPLFGGIVVESLGANGEAPAPGRFTDGFWRVSVNAVAFDGDTLLGMTEPFAGASGLSGASVARIGGDGRLIHGPSLVGASPELAWQRMVRRGPDAIVAWFGYLAPLYVARLRP